MSLFGFGFLGGFLCSLLGSFFGFFCFFGYVFDDFDFFLGFFGSGFSLGLFSFFHLGTEAVYATGSVDEFLFASVKGVALAAEFGVHFLNCGADGHDITAGAGYFCV